MRSKLRTFVLGILVILTSCAGAGVLIAPVDDEYVKESFDFLVVEKTTKQEIYDRFGKPHRTYDDGLVILYKVNEYENKIFEVDSGYWEKINVLERYSLVLVFHENGVLQRYRLVRRGIVN
jgi:hypothetical protein